MKLGMNHRGRLPTIVCINHDVRLTMTYFSARSILVTYGLQLKKVKALNFQEILKPVT